MQFFKPEETTQQQKVVGETLWHDVRFEFKDPQLKPNQYNPDRDQLAWGIFHQGQNMLWYIGQKSVEEALNAIGPVGGTTVRVAKIRTGPKKIEVEWAVEFVKGKREPRNIRASVENNGTVPLNPVTDPIRQQVQSGGGGGGDEEPFYDEGDDYFETQGIPANEVRVPTNPSTQVGTRSPSFRVAPPQQYGFENNEAGAERAEYVYPPLDEPRLELIRVLAEDQAKMAAIMLEAFREHMPSATPENEIHTYVRGGLVGLSFDILSLDRDHRVPRVGLKNYVPLPQGNEPIVIAETIVQDGDKLVYAEPPDIVEEVELDIESMSLDEKMNHVETFMGLSKSDLVKELMEYLVDLHSRVKSIEHARNVIKLKLGYEMLPTDEESLKSMVHEYIVYNDARADDMDDETACITVSNECGRHPELMPPLNKKDDGK